jgi:hypothetical protein
MSSVALPRPALPCCRACREAVFAIALAPFFILILISFAVKIHFLDK